jgi:elongator complex protein 3
LGDKDFQKIFPKNKFEWPCHCIRCREIGFAKDLQKQDIQLVRRDYKAGDGLETFLSFESVDKKIIYALLRLRNPSQEIFAGFYPTLKNSALIREVHSYGSEISVGDSKGKSRGQHRGLGTKLIAEAEKIAKNEWKKKKMVVISGIGTREYYQKFGYKLNCTYMVKGL